MLPGKVQGLLIQLRSSQMLVRLSVVGQYGRHLRCRKEVQVTHPVLRRQLPATIQLPCQFVYIHRGHLHGQLIGQGLKSGSGKRLSSRLVEHDLCIR